MGAVVPYRRSDVCIIPNQPLKGIVVMPKMKSHSGAKKRFKETGNGKIKRKKANKGHLLTKKTSKRKRQLRKSVIIDDKANEERIKKMLAT